MLSISFVILLLLFGRWLIRATRSIDRVATVMDKHDVSFDFLGYQGNTKAILLFSDVRFIVWLIGKQYSNSGLPFSVSKALDEARRSYLSIVAVFSLIVFVGFLIAHYSGPAV